MLKLFFVAFVVVVLYLIYKEWKKLTAEIEQDEAYEEVREIRNDSLNRKLAQVEDKFEETVIDEQVVTLEEAIAKKEGNIAERRAKLKSTKEGS